MTAFKSAIASRGLHLQNSNTLFVKSLFLKIFKYSLTAFNLSIAVCSNCLVTALSFRGKLATPAYKLHRQWPAYKGALAALCIQCCKIERSGAGLDPRASQPRVGAAARDRSGPLETARDRSRPLETARDRSGPLGPARPAKCFYSPRPSQSFLCKESKERFEVRHTPFVPWRPAATEDGHYMIDQ